MIDIGIRVKGTPIIKIGAESLASHKLRIRKDGVTYGIPLLSIDDYRFSPVRIRVGGATYSLPRLVDLVVPTAHDASSESTRDNIINTLFYQLAAIMLNLTRHRAAQKLTLTGHKLTQVKFYLRKEGSPTGTAYARVRRVSNDSIIETSATTLNVATLSTSYAWKTFTFTCYPNETVYVCIEYTVGDNNNYVRVAYKETNVIEGEGWIWVLPPYYWSAYGTTDLTIQILFAKYSKENTIDESTSTFWQPHPANQAGAWITWALASIKNTTGCRIYWGSESAYRPTNYKIYTSLDNSSWTERKHETADPGAGWKSYSWKDASTRYIKLVVTTHGSSGTRIYEARAVIVL